MCFVAFSKILGAYPVIMIGRREERLKLANELGADFIINNTRENVKNKVLEYTNGTGATHIIIALDNYNLINDTFSYMQKDGKIGIYGVSYPPKFNLNWENAPASWSLGAMHYDERDAHQQVVDSIKLGFINPKKFYSHIVSLDDINDGFQLIEEKKALKVVVKMK